MLDVVFAVCGKCRSAWRSSVAAAVFSAIELCDCPFPSSSVQLLIGSDSLLFLFTTLVFIYYYHCHLANNPAYGVSGRATGGTPHDTTHGTSNPVTGPAAGIPRTKHTGIAAGVGEQHPLRTSPTHAHGHSHTHHTSLNSSPTTAHGHTGLNDHSPAAEGAMSGPVPPLKGSTYSPTRFNSLNYHGAGKSTPGAAGNGASENGAGHVRVGEPINDPNSPVSVSQFPQPPKTGAQSSSTGPPYPLGEGDSTPKSPTRPGRPESYGVETGSSVGPGAGVASTRPKADD